MFEELLKGWGLTAEQFRDLLPTLPEEKQRELLALMETGSKLLETNRMASFKPYDYQKEFFNAGATNRSRFLMAANRLGKTYGGGIEMAYHLTNLYPDWWEGKRFNTAILGWCLGITGDSTRRVLQKELFGTEDARQEALLGTGSIPKDHIVSLEKDGGRIVSAKIKRLEAGQTVDTWVNAVSNLSTVEFRSTEQGETTLMGSAVHVIFMDEEHPRHSQTLFAQCVTRTATTDGIVYITATPENGLTSLIEQFQTTDSMYIQSATWDDAPHLTPQIQADLLASIPEWQHEMRSKGIPVLGSGLVYPVAQSTYECEPFTIPKHYLQLGSVDFGFVHPTVFSKLAYDIENDIIYLTYQQQWIEQTPNQIAPGLKVVSGGVEIVYPHDGNTASKDTGETLADRYRALDCNLQVQCFKNPAGGIGVEEGVVEILERMRDGRFKVFNTCALFFKDAQRYQRKDGVINKQAYDPDAADSARYGVMRLVAGDGITGSDLQAGTGKGWLSTSAAFNTFDVSNRFSNEF